MERNAFAKSAAQPQSGKPAMFACAAASATAAILIIRTLSLSLGVLLSVLCGILVGLVLLLRRPRTET